MKKLANIMLGLAGVAALAACSNDEVAPAGVATDITVSVSTDAAAGSRALATLDGYTLTAVMQLVDDNGATVGAQATADAAAGSASFTIKADAIDAGASKAIFWAEYVPTATAAKVYNSADLTNITLAVTDFDATTMAAADAFAGTITTLSNDASATLTRPMVQFNFRPNNPEVAAGDTKLTTTYETTSGYNVLTGNCADAYQAVTITNAAFDAATKDAWVSSFIFAPANMATFDKEITMTLEGPAAGSFAIAAGTLPLDANYILNITGDINLGGTPDNPDVIVNVDINGNYVNEPKPATFEVGSYVNAAGVPVSNVEDAAAIIYYVGVQAGDDASLYPAEYAGKTIKGYAVALVDAVPTRQQFNSATIADGLPACQDLTNGSVNQSVVFAALGQSAFVNVWNTWVAANPLTAVGTATTDWYLPARAQMEIWFGMIMPTTYANGDVVEPANAEFKAMFPYDTIFDRHSEGNWQGCMYATSSVNNSNNTQGGSLSISSDGTGAAAKFSQIDIKTKTQSVLGRAMFTIFE